MTDQLARPLTKREVAVLRHRCRGLTNPEVADVLFVSPQTVKNHVTAAFRKLGFAGKRGTMALACYRMGYRDGKRVAGQTGLREAA